MTFDEWVRVSNLSDLSVAEKLGVPGIYIGRYRRGETIPRSDMMKKIYDLTNGQVEPNSFFNFLSQNDHGNEKTLQFDSLAELEFKSKKLTILEKKTDDLGFQLVKKNIEIKELKKDIKKLNKSISKIKKLTN